MSTLLCIHYVLQTSEHISTLWLHVIIWNKCIFFLYKSIIYKWRLKKYQFYHHLRFHFQWYKSQENPKRPYRTKRATSHYSHSSLPGDYMLIRLYRKWIFFEFILQNLLSIENKISFPMVFAELKSVEWLLRYRRKRGS